MNGRSSHAHGFSLVELIIVIAIIGIMAALIVAVVTNATQDTRMVLARQQTAVIQEALNAWISRYTLTNSLAGARGAYTAQGNARAKLDNLLQDYLDPSTYGHFTNFTADGAGVLSTEALGMNGKALSFSAWSNVADRPVVTIVNAP